MNRDNLVAFYESDLARYGPEDARSLHWASARTQRIRFEVLYAVGPWDGVSVADVGCGLGDFAGFLVSKGHTVKPGPGPGRVQGPGAKVQGSSPRAAGNIEHRTSHIEPVYYNGYDVAPAMVQAARRKYPQAAFHRRDVLTEGFIAPADYVLASGTFNIRVEDHDTWFRAALAAMYAACRRAVAFNFLGLPPDFSKYGPKKSLPERRPEVLEGALEGHTSSLSPQSSVLQQWHNLYYEVAPDEVLAYCRTLSPHVTMQGGYLPGDHTVYVYRV